MRTFILKDGGDCVETISAKINRNALIVLQSCMDACIRSSVDMFAYFRISAK